MRHILYSLLPLFFSVTAFAGEINQQKAKKIAEDFMAARGKSVESRQQPHKAIRRQSNRNTRKTFYYVFNAASGDGFVVVSADDRTTPILGYADKGSFREDRLPQNARAFLQGYIDEMERLDAQGTKPAVAQAPSRPIRAGLPNAVEPLLKMEWNQYAPYNDLCPNYFTYEGEQLRSVTGCVATAVAQIMKHHRHPEATLTDIPALSCKYVTVDGVKSVSVPAIGQGTPLAWDKMVANHEEGATSQAQNEAVATLMRCVGQAVGMRWGRISNAGGTGNVTDALKYHFGYDDGVRVVYRSRTTRREFTDTICAELAAGRPVFMAASNTGGGHVMVIDGYTADGLFHVNWGWGGNADGNYVLSVLNPGDNTGAGASPTSDGYSLNQNVIIGIQPPDGVPFHIDETNVMRSHFFTFKEAEKTISYDYWNATSTSIDVEFGLGTIAQDGFITPVYTYSHKGVGATKGFWAWDFSVDALSSKPGVHRVIPISRLMGTTRFYPNVVNPQENYTEVTVAGDGTMQMRQMSELNDITVVQVDFPANMKPDWPQNVKVTFDHKGNESYQPVYFFASRTPDKGKPRSCTAVTFAKNGLSEGLFYFVPNAEGTWNYWLSLDKEGKDPFCSGGIGVGEGNDPIEDPENPGQPPSPPVEPDPPLIPEDPRTLAFAGLHVANSEGSHFYGSIMEASIKLLNRDSIDYQGMFKVALLLDVNEVVGMKDVPVFMPANTHGETHRFHFTDLEPGREYILRITFADGREFAWSPVYTCVPSVTCFNAEGLVQVMRQAPTISIPAKATFVDMRGVAGVNVVHPNDNPNTVYLVDLNVPVPAGLEACNVVKGYNISELRLTDGYDFFVSSSFYADKAVYTRRRWLAANGQKGWSTIVLPFEVNSLKNGNGTPVSWARSANAAPQALQVKRYMGNAGNSLLFKHVTGMRANTPHIVAWAGEHNGNTNATTDREVQFVGTNVLIDAYATPGTIIEDYGFRGVLSTTDLGEVYRLNSEGNAFVRTAGPINAFRAYFLRNPSAGVGLSTLSINHYDNDPTDVADVKAGEQQPAADTPIFDTTGRQVGTVGDFRRLPKGIYIIKGRKLVKR